VRCCICCCWAWRPRHAERRAAILARWGYFSVLGLLGVGAYNALQYLALTTSTPINVTLIASSMPLWMLTVGALFFRERPQPRQLLGAALSLAGVATVMGRGDPAALAQVHFVQGDLFMLAAAASWAGYSWLLARPPALMRPPARPDWHWAEFLCIQMVPGLLWATAFAGIGAWLQPGAQAVIWSPALLLALAYVGIFPSLVAYRLWGLGVSEAGPTVAAFFGNLTPLFAALLGAAMLGEWPQAFHGLAFALIVAGIVVSSRPARPT
jgi:drug/metabolite transporter (DMT)-like permease